MSRMTLADGGELLKISAQSLNLQDQFPSLVITHVFLRSPNMYPIAKASDMRGRDTCLRWNCEIMDGRNHVVNVSPIQLAKRFRTEDASRRQPPG